ncbi:hypothetical protein BCR34DRAFT_671468 [Clohesyomyces aquaticus]|uniref:NodB homology domain-containing protein n=1 Tax=Clohesyomyces aquaticus TaxID=1231657 RepID=A0A1Y2A337_9PLEO|nr:hypothetical protein BCR34DRAFT_671468 [Clohesyomyces aquaticus]
MAWRVAQTPAMEAFLQMCKEGVFGATHGVERLVDLWEKKNIKRSWYIPRHTIEMFPEAIAKIRDAGHKMSTLIKTMNIQTDFCNGKPPLGFTSPSWKNHPDQIEILTKLGINYDHSFMHGDFQPYYVSTGKEECITTDYKKDPETWMVPMKHAEKSDVVEIPANWTLDDWPTFRWDGARPNAHGYVEAYVVERMWKDMFSWCYREPHILLMHKRMIDWIDEHEGVEWCTFAQMAEEFQNGPSSGKGK